MEAQLKSSELKYLKGTYENKGGRGEGWKGGREEVRQGDTQTDGKRHTDGRNGGREGKRHTDGRNETHTRTE